MASGGTKSITVAAATGGGTGFATVLYGITQQAPSYSVGGTCVVIISLAVFMLVTIRRWVTKTAEERRCLRDATDKLEEERSRYVVAQAALQSERDRIRSDLDAAQKRMDKRIEVERTAMWQEFEDKRSELMRSVYEVAAVHGADGVLETPAPPAPGASGAQVLHLPAPAPAAERQHERATRPS